MGIKILHTADYHIGMTFDGYGNRAEELAQARVDVLDRLVEAGNHAGCDLLVISGDMFDRVSVAQSRVQEAVEKLKDFSGKAVLILPGNHDYLNERSGLWDAVESALPDHGIILKETAPLSLAPFGLPEVVVYPGPCPERTSGENAISWICDQQMQDEKVSLGVAHGSLEGVSPDFEGRYYPMNRSQLAESGIDLWLLGHTHIPYPDPEEGILGNIFYAGTPEPDGMDCHHLGSCWIIDVDSEGVSSGERLSRGKFRFEDQQTQVLDTHQLQELIESYQDRSDTFLRLKLEGWIPRQDYEKYIRSGQNLLRSRLSEGVYHLELILDELHPQVDGQVIDEEFTEGSFPHRLLKEVEANGDTQTLQTAYQLIKEVQENEAE